MHRKAHAFLGTGEVLEHSAACLSAQTCSRESLSLDAFRLEASYFAFSTSSG